MTHMGQRAFRFFQRVWGQAIPATNLLGPLFAILLVGCRGEVSADDAPRTAPDASVPDVIDASQGNAIGTVTAPDCQGCSFPEQASTECQSAPPVKIIYPPDGALLPPNLGTLSVQWVPHGASFSHFEVDFSQSEQAPFTDWRIVTACSAETTDQQGFTSGGCELTLDKDSWNALAEANRGGNPLTITVRGTTDGACASTSENSIRISLAEEDVDGTMFYWKSVPASLGLSGQIYTKKFGDMNRTEQDFSSPTFGKPQCTGCHTLAHDGSRMLAFPADDTDPDYAGLEGALVDIANWPSKAAALLAQGQPPGWTALATTSSSYLTSNGLPCAPQGNELCPQSEGATYPSAVPANSFSAWDSTTGAFIGSASAATSGTRATMPALSADGTSIVYVQPAAVGSWDEAARNDDDHIFGGSLFTASLSSSVLGPAIPLVASQGENNYYPTYSPDLPPTFVLFDRAPLDSSVSSLAGCMGTIPKATCPNDSFANPAARVLLVANASGASPVDLEQANGTPASVNARVSNSFPRFLPTVQHYKGKRLFWITFSSTRDYGVRLLNHKDGMYQCYPADSLEWPGSVHRNFVDKSCQHPQVWMAPVLEGDEASGGDPSGVAFWIPNQDIGSHNHMAQWTSR